MNCKNCDHHIWLAHSNGKYHKRGEWKHEYEKAGKCRHDNGRCLCPKAEPIEGEKIMKN
jgi:hypothetical protein